MQHGNGTVLDTKTECLLKSVQELAAGPKMMQLLPITHEAQGFHAHALCDREHPPAGLPLSAPPRQMQVEASYCLTSISDDELFDAKWFSVTSDLVSKRRKPPHDTQRPIGAPPPCRKGFNWHANVPFTDGWQHSTDSKFSVNHVMISRQPVGSQKKARKSASRLWCHLYLDEHMLHKDFGLVPKLIGKGGENIRPISDETGAKIRIRGRGSCHIETESGQEANAHLMVAITTEHERSEDFERAFRSVVRVAQEVAGRFETFCHSSHYSCVPRRRIWIGDACEGSKEALDKILDQTWQ